MVGRQPGQHFVAEIVEQKLLPGVRRLPRAVGRLRWRYDCTQ